MPPRGDDTADGRLHTGECEALCLPAAGARRPGQVPAEGARPSPRSLPKQPLPLPAPPPPRPSGLAACDRVSHRTCVPFPAGPEGLQSHVQRLYLVQPLLSLSQHLRHCQGHGCVPPKVPEPSSRGL